MGLISNDRDNPTLSGCGDVGLHASSLPECATAASWQPQGPNGAVSVIHRENEPRALVPNRITQEL